MNLRKTAIIALALSGTFLVQPAFAEPELKGSPTELTEHLKSIPKVVQVTGEAELKVPADKAIVTLRVRTENKSLQEALKQNQSIRGKILKALSDENIPTERIQSAKFSSTPKFGMFGDKAKSYQVENNMRITLKDEKEFQVVAEMADKLPEVNYEGAKFEHSDKEQLKLKAIGEANANAVMRKKVYEETLGIKLTPKRFWENAAVVPMERDNRYAPSVSKIPELGTITGILTDPNYKMTIRAIEQRSDASEVISSFAELTFKAQVVVEYSVESK